MADTPTLHLWNYIVGAGKVHEFGGGDVHVHLPAALAAAVAQSCGKDTASIYLDLIAHTAARTVGVMTEPDSAHRIKRKLRGKRWKQVGEVEALVHAECHEGESTVKVTGPDPLEALPEPDLPNYKTIPKWQSKMDGLHDPVRSAVELPAIITARASGRPGWAIRVGRDIAGERIGTGSTAAPRFPYAGWPLLVVSVGERVELVQAEWAIEDRAAGEVAAVRLTRFEWPERRAKRPAPELVLGYRLAAVARGEEYVEEVESEPEDPLDALLARLLGEGGFMTDIGK